MPFYEYEHDSTRGPSCPDLFEVLQSMNDSPLETCPSCGKPCHRVLSTFSVSGSARGLLSTSNLEKHGFTQYKRAGTGRYEKTAGAGPREIIGE